MLLEISVWRSKLLPSTCGQAIGYARVSAAHQDLARQQDVLGYADKLFSEKLGAEIVTQTSHRLSKHWHSLRCRLIAWKGT